MQARGSALFWRVAMALLRLLPVEHRLLSPTALSARLLRSRPHTRTHAHCCSLANWQCILGATLDRSRFLLWSHRNSSVGDLGCSRSVSHWERGKGKRQRTSAGVCLFVRLFVFLSFFHSSRTFGAGISGSRVVSVMTVPPDSGN